MYAEQPWQKANAKGEKLEKKPIGANYITIVKKSMALQHMP